MDPDLPRLCMFAVRDIIRGEQLTFDYRQRTDGLEEETAEKSEIDMTDQKSGMECKCGSSKCRKIMFH